MFDYLTKHKKYLALLNTHAHREKLLQYVRMYDIFILYLLLTIGIWSGN